MGRIFSLALGDLADPRIIGIVLRSLLITLLIFAALGMGIGWALNGANPCVWFGGDDCAIDALGSGIGAVVLTLLLIWLLFPAIALGVICAFIETIARIVEERHYPQAAILARPTGLIGGAALGLRSAARVILYNLLALPLYILLLVTGIGTLIAFVVINGLAFGQDLGEMVASRHGDRVARRAWLARTRGSRMAIGIAVTGLFLVPFANLLAPIIGVSMMIHLYHLLPRR